MITLTTLNRVPPFAQGLVRDLRIRWALEELGLSYETRLLSMEEKAAPAHVARQPFAQVPSYEEGDLTLFESGAILLHVAAKNEKLLPNEPNARARATAWVIAALNSVEPAVQNLASIDLFYPSEAWAKERRPGAEQQVIARLDQLTQFLGERDHLEDRFTAGDLMMASVLRNLRQTDLLSHYPTLSAYKDRCEARPAFQRALKDHMAAFN